MLADTYKGLEIIRTFTKNGKSYARVKIPCDRCDGSGFFGNCGVCYKCSGNQFFTKDVRNYTDAEYAQLQRAKEKYNAKREAKREAKRVARLQEANVQRLHKYGFEDVYAYAIVGNTYEMREELKQHGAKFSYELLWVSPTKPTWLAPEQYTKISVEDVFEFNGGCLNVKDTAQDFIRSLQPLTGVYLGEVGDKVIVTVTVQRVIDYETCYRPRWPTTTYKHIMHTEDGNQVTWSTQSTCLPEGHKYTIKGTIKALSEYRGECVTQLTRCKIIDKEV